MFLLMFTINLASPPPPSHFTTGTVINNFEDGIAKRTTNFGWPKWSLKKSAFFNNLYLNATWDSFPVLDHGVFVCKQVGIILIFILDKLLCIHDHLLYSLNQTSYFV